jgi:hypothetical protein
MRLLRGQLFLEKDAAESDGNIKGGFAAMRPNRPPLFLLFLQRQINHRSVPWRSVSQFAELSLYHVCSNLSILQMAF